MQRSFEDLGVPLQEVTFCVLDLETTGGSPEHCAITEVGAVKVRAGEVLGTFHTMVNPGCAVPPSIVLLTGITDSMVVRAPRIEAVLPALTEFWRDTVLVGHNVRFDAAFLEAALARDGRAPLGLPLVDTAALARRLLRDEVPNCRLGTLAERLRLAHRPCHRALDDALATVDLLHLLLERAGRLGVCGLDDLRGLPTLAGSPQAVKLRLTERLPRSPGVYLFRDGRRRVLYVGKATNLRARVRQYFSSDERRKVGALLRETEAIDHKRCVDPLEAEVLEARLIRLLAPRFNRRGRRWEGAVLLRLSLRERYPRLSVTRRAAHDGDLLLGPLPSQRFATTVIEAVHTALPLRRCTTSAAAAARRGACIPAQLGVSLCPCRGDVAPEEYAPVVRAAVEGLTRRPDLLLAPLEDRMRRLAAEERFEEAALTRDRLAALAESLRRQRRFDELRRAGRIVARREDGLCVELRHGVLTHLWHADPGALDGGRRPLEARPDDPGPPEAGPLPPELVDEVRLVGRWLDRHAGRLRPLRVDGEWASTWPPVPTPV